jgi:DNA-directed RNA polymerase subunit M/transcription elongation factor TFIIS
MSTDVNEEIGAGLAAGFISLARWNPTNLETRQRSLPEVWSCGHGEVGIEKLESTYKDATAVLLWMCTRCDHRWPFKSANVA